MEDLEASGLCNLGILPDGSESEKDSCNGEACKSQSYRISHADNDRSWSRDISSLVQLKGAGRSYVLTTIWVLSRVKVRLYTVRLAQFPNKQGSPG